MGGDIFSGFLKKTNKVIPFHYLGLRNFKIYETESVCTFKFYGVDEKTLIK